MAHLISHLKRSLTAVQLLSGLPLCTIILVGAGSSLSVQAAMEGTRYGGQRPLPALPVKATRTEIDPVHLPHTPASIAAPYLYDVSDEPPPAPFEGTVIDDLSDEFSLQGPQTYWHETDFGYNGHFWWTKNTASGVENVGRWSLSNFDAGTYDIYVYIPGANSTTHQARYSIHHAGEVDIVTVDQSNHRETWYKLGAFELKGFGKEYVELTDETGEPDLSFEVAFDAIGVLQQEPGFEEKIVDALWTKIQPWLDKLGEEIKSRFGEWLEEQKAKLLRSLADSLKSWIDQQCANVGAALVLPLFAFILWRKKRNNI